MVGDDLKVGVAVLVRDDVLIDSGVVVKILAFTDTEEMLLASSEITLHAAKIITELIMAINLL
jgi:hypothetical protein